MTTTTETKTTKFTVTPVLTKEEARAVFLKKIGKAKEDGSNSSVDMFLILMDNMIAQGRTFTFSDLLFQGRSLDIPPYELNQLFKKWATEMIRLNKLQSIHGAYDEEIFNFT